MSDAHNPMRPLFVEVPSIRDDLRAVLEGIVTAAVEAARPAPAPAPRRTWSVVGAAMEVLAMRQALAITGAAEIRSRRSCTTRALEVDARCGVCGKWARAVVDEIAVEWAGLRGGLVLVLDTVGAAVESHVCDLELG